MQPPTQVCHCHSCAAPLAHPDFRSQTPHYCQYCVDEHGAVKPREEVQAGIRRWMVAWQPPMDDATLARRIDDYMRAMPHWSQ